MGDVLAILRSLFASMFRTRGSLEAENIILRHQLNILRRSAPRKSRLTNLDRLVFVWLYRLFPVTLDAVTVIRPETIVRWHRSGFRLFWRWRSRPRGGRPGVPAETRRLIRDITLANPLWGAPRIHGELLKLDIEIGQTTVAKYMARGH